MSNKPGTFTKGDARINRKGRPRTFDAFRELAQSIAHEAAKAGGQPIEIDGHLVTVTEAILRQWATSKDPRLQMAFIEIAYGKVPQRQEITGADGGAIKQETRVVEIRAVDYRTVAAKIAPGSVPDSDAPGESQSTFDGPEMG